MHIERFDPVTETEPLRTCHEIRASGWSVDHPDAPPVPFEAFASEWRQTPHGMTRQTWLATDDHGIPVGCYGLILPQLENLTTAFGVPVVALDHRRRGYGTAILAHCAEQARAAGRSKLSASVRDDSPGSAFARAQGAVGGIENVQRIMDIGPELPVRLARLRREAQQHATAYETLSWIGATPEEHLEHLAPLLDTLADAPSDTGVEVARWDGDRVRRAEAAILAAGAAWLTVAARLRASGELAAVTQLLLPPGMPDWAIQDITGVRSQHRGHRLGLLVKVTMLDLLAAEYPEVRHIFTGNAAANQHMIAINEQLGYRISGVYRSWELDLAAR